jgi:hypothetical protein
MKNWIKAAQPYRHGQELRQLKNPPEPPMDFMIAHLTGCGKLRECRHSGARALPASPESKNTDQTNQLLGLCSWVPGPALTGRPGTTRKFFISLLSAGRHTSGG